MMKFWHILLIGLTSACTPPERSPLATAAKQGCDMKPGTYNIQEARYDQENMVYSLMVLGAPTCVKQPVEFPELQLMRLEDSEKESAVLAFNNETDVTLKMKSDFKITLVTPVKSSDGTTTGHETSFWTPMLTSAAGAMVGGMLINKFFNRPRHVTPPSSQPGRSVTGVGSYGSSRKEAVTRYQRQNPSTSRFKTSPARTQKKSFFSKKSRPTTKSKSRFFRSRSRRR